MSIHLIGHSYAPEVTLGNNSKIFFPPTFSGVSSKTKLPIKNESRIPLEIEWKVPEKYMKEIIFEPAKTMLLPNEESKVVATFTPLKRKEYHISVPLYARNIYDNIKDMIGFYNPGSGLIHRTNPQKSLVSTSSQKFNDAKMVRYELEVIGAGADGMISLNPKALDFGTITVGFTK